MTFLESIDKEKSKKKLLIVISALTLVALALLLVIIVVSIAPGGIKGFKNYTVTEQDINTGTLILADDDHPYNYTIDASSLELCSSYRDANLKKDENGNPINKYILLDVNDMKLEKQAMAAAHKMLVDVEANLNKADLEIQYTYGFNLEDREEYKTALLIYLANKNDGKLDAAYSNWLDANAAKYGFIESFEDGYRYVGEAHAAYMKAKSMTLAQYIAYLKNNTSHENPLDVTDANGVKYQVYYVSCKAGDEIKVPKNDYTISGTNEGGVIITAKVSK